MKYHRTYTINQSMATSNTFHITFGQTLDFQPTHVIIKQLTYCNIGAGADNGTYLLWCSLTGSYVGHVYVGIQGTVSNPQSVISIPTMQPSVTFRLESGNTANFTGPTGNLTVTLEFIQK